MESQPARRGWDVKLPAPQNHYGLYNGCTLFFVGRRARDCRHEAENVTGVPWSECREYMQILPVVVSVGRIEVRKKAFPFPTKEPRHEG